MLLLIDNYDSFVHNLARYFQQLGEPTRVVRNDAIDAAGVRRLAPRAVVLSPGPCGPEEAGSCVEMVQQLHAELPMLGVCLGHQAIAAALGGQITRATQPVHGRASQVQHHGEQIFRGVPNPLKVGRYHSLVVDPASLPTVLVPTAWTADDTTDNNTTDNNTTDNNTTNQHTTNQHTINQNTINQNTINQNTINQNTINQNTINQNTTNQKTLMAFEHRELPVFGVQFHPESILTDAGLPLLKNFLNIAANHSSAPCPAVSAAVSKPVSKTASNTASKTEAGA